MRYLGALVLVAFGCSEDPPDNGPAIDSHVHYYEWPGAVPPHLDVLVVVENTAAMTPHQAALATIPAATDTALFTAGATFPDVRIAVTLADGSGTLRQPATTTDKFLALPYDVRLARSTNFTGTLTDALGELMNVGTSGTAAVQPLASVKAALDANPDFARAGFLGIVMLTAGDDASTGATSDFATDLKTRKSDPLLVMVSGAHELPVTRLAAFYDQFPNRNVSVDLGSNDVAQAIGWFQYGFLRTLGLACFREPADVDAATPGKQYECDLNVYYDDDTTERVVQCATGVTSLCFELVPNLQACVEPGYAEVKFRNFPSPYVPPIRGQCVVTGPN